MPEATLLGLDGEVVATIQIPHAVHTIKRPVAQPLTLDQLKTLTSGEWGIEEDDAIPPLAGDFDDPRIRLPEITVEVYERISGLGDSLIYRLVSDA